MRQVPLAFPWFYCVLSLISLVFQRFCLLLLASAVWIRKVRARSSRWLFPGFTVF